MNHSNWAGNLQYHAQTIAAPATVAEAQSLVASTRKVKALGSRHSFNTVADTDGIHLTTTLLNLVEQIGEGFAVVQSGVRYGDLALALHAKGWALENMASLPHISVAGAVATATHGSGNRRQVLSAAVQAFDLITADGDLVHVSPETFGDRFPGAVVHLGLLGVVTRLWLKTVPSFSLRQDVFEHLPLESALNHYEEISASGESVSLFTTWSDQTEFTAWIKGGHFDGEAPKDFYGATPAEANRHVIGGLPPEPCTAQMGVVGPWHERLPHFRMEFTPSAGEELQSEYLVP